MTVLVIRPIIGGDVEELMENMRQVDRDEMAASTRRDPETAIRQGIKVSDVAYCATIDGELACLFGVVPGSMLTRVGVPWMLGTDIVESHPITIGRQSKVMLDPILASYNHVLNYVDDRNHITKRWLRWLGFSLSQPRPHGPNGLPFRKFERKN